MLFHLLIVGHTAVKVVNNAASMSGKYNGAQAIKNNSTLLLYPLLVVATHLIKVVMMLLNVFQKQVPTSELYK